jgi:hypothetical protein
MNRNTIILSTGACGLILVSGGMYAYKSLSSSPQGQPIVLKGSQEAYIADLSNCFAKNHTLVNPEEVARFLSGIGSDDVQTLKFLSNKDLKSVDLKAKASENIIPGVGKVRAEVGGKLNFEGYTLEAVNLRRKMINGSYAFKADQGRIWIPKFMSVCENHKRDWALFDKSLNYKFVEDK